MADRIHHALFGSAPIAVSATALSLDSLALPERLDETGRSLPKAG